MADPVATEKAAELAAKEKIDLADVKGTGSEGRIGVEDVRAAVAKRSEEEKSGSSGSGSSSSSSSKSSKKASGETMPERAHKEGCPADTDRIEFYDQQVPPKTRSDGQVEKAARTARMAHCVECGQTVEIS